MTANGTGDEFHELLEARVEALQAVVDRISSWQDSAPQDTIRDELDAALVDVGLDLDEGVRRRIVTQIHAHEAVDVRALLT
jgi:hypothetical protein